MSLATVQQLYTDVQTVVQKDGAGQLVEEETAAVFNAELAEAKQAHPAHSGITAIPEIRAGNTRMGDVLVCIGSLRAKLEELTPPPAPRAVPGGSPPPRRTTF